MRYDKLDRGAKKRWVKALRSGKYKQGTGQLVRERDGVDEFCCLGVYCEISTRAKRNGVAYIVQGTNSTDDEITCQSETSIPNPLARAMNLDPDATSHLIRMNDQNHNTFDQIADWIEANL